MKSGLVRGFLSVGLWTLISRASGFVRDILMAAWLGTGAVAEAFLIALSLPNMFRRFFAEGAFNTAFIPMFSKKLEDPDDAQRFAREAFSGLFLTVLALSAVAMIFMPGLVWLMASGFAGDERFDLAVEYGRITFPYILLISMASMISGV
ncbi:murein biosynthesis integral membrane protein MurJ, partial [Paracoccus sp. PAMC 22219]|uniref:murein biosynthesis integral membrane protein MurJ n=1 Tax=Paracoccus sp. PAMC 22219 TaxID=1569209 RepID=UPI0026F3954C